MRSNNDLENLSNDELLRLYEASASKESSIGRKLAIGAKGAAVGALTAIPNTISLSGNVPTYAANLAGYLLGNDALKNIPAPIPYVSDYLNEGINKLTNDYFVPRTFGEKAINTSSDLLGGGANIARAGATKAASSGAQRWLAPQNARDYAALAGTGVGLEAGKEAVPESIAVPLLGALIGGSAAGLGAGTAQSAGKKIAGSLPEKFSNALNHQTLPPQQQTALALSDKFKVPLTQGQASQNLMQMTKEDLLASGAQGMEAANIINTARTEGAEAFQNAAKETRKTIGGGEFIEKGQSLQGLIDKISKTSKNEKRAIDDAYKIAKENVGYLDLKDIKGFDKVARAKFVEEGITPENAPNAYQQLKSFNRIFAKVPKGAKGVDFRRIEAFRQGLIRSSKGAQEQDRYGIDILKHQFDDYLDDTIETALIHGDTAVLEQFKNARKLSHDWKKKYTAKDKSQFGKKFLEDVLSAEEPYTYSMISDKIFGANKYGFKPEAVSIIKELKKHLGANSIEFNGLKLDATQKIIKPLLNKKGELNFNSPYIQTYKNNLKENEVILKELLSPNELKQLYDLGDLGSLMFQSKKSVGNPTQSGLVNALTKLPYMQEAMALPFVKEVPHAYYAHQAKKAVNQNGLDKQLKILNRAEEKMSPELIISNAARGPSTSNGNPQEASTLPLENLSNEEFNRLYNESLQEGAGNSQENNVQDVIKSSAVENGLSPQFVEKIAKVESNLNPKAKNPKSSASGLFQFTNGTWKEMVRRYGKEKNINLQDKNDPKANAVMASLYLKNNAEQLQNILHRDPTQGEVYGSHVLGLGGMKKLISNYDSEKTAAQLFPNEAKVNRTMFYKNGRPISTAQLYDFFTKKMI